MAQNIFEQYSLVQAQIDVLEEQKKQLREQIQANMEERGVTKEETALGKFSFTERSSWVFSPKVSELKDAVKAQEEFEKSSGDATKEVSKILTFTKLKI